MGAHTRDAEVLFFTTPHCSICKTMRPIADEIAYRYDGAVTMVEIDSATDSESSSTHRVRGVPTFIAMRDGSEVGRVVGSRSPTQLEALFEAASSGSRIRWRIAPTDRALRLGVGGVFAGVALVTSTPVLWIFAVAALVFATWDVVR